MAGSRRAARRLLRLAAARLRDRRPVASSTRSRAAPARCCSVAGRDPLPRRAPVRARAGGRRADHRRHPRTGRRRRARGIGAALLTGLFIAAYTVWDAHAVDALAPAAGRLLLGRGGDPGAAARAVRARRPGDLGAQPRAIVGVGILSPLAYVLVLFALTRAPISLVAPVRESSVVVGALLGARVLGEGQIARRIVAAARDRTRHRRARALVTSAPRCYGARVPLTRSREARKEPCARSEGRPRRGRHPPHARAHRARDRREEQRPARRPRGHPPPRRAPRQPPAPARLRPARRRGPARGHRHRVLPRRRRHPRGRPGRARLQPELPARGLHGRAGRRRALHRPHRPRRDRGAVRLRAPRPRPARRAGRPRPPRAADPPRLRRARTCRPRAASA